MSAPSKRYCKRFKEKGTSRKPETGEVVADTQLVQNPLPYNLRIICLRSYMFKIIY